MTPTCHHETRNVMNHESLRHEPHTVSTFDTRELTPTVVC